MVLLSNKELIMSVTTQTNQVQVIHGNAAVGYEADDIWIFPSESQAMWDLYTTLEQSYSRGKQSIFAKIWDWILER